MATLLAFLLIWVFNHQVQILYACKFSIEYLFSHKRSLKIYGNAIQLYNNNSCVNETVLIAFRQIFIWQNCFEFACHLQLLIQYMWQLFIRSIHQFKDIQMNVKIYKFSQRVADSKKIAIILFIQMRIYVCIYID